MQIGATAVEIILMATAAMAGEMAMDTATNPANKNKN